MLKLTNKERQVVALLVAGATYEEIAQQLNIKLDSAKKYRYFILKKLHCSSTREIIEWAYNCPSRLRPPLLQSIFSSLVATAPEAVQSEIH